MFVQNLIQLPGNTMWSHTAGDAP